MPSEMIRLSLALLFVLVPALAHANPDALIGAGVGNADTFVSEGSKLFNKKQYGKAAEQFLKATRANPALVQTYLPLARAQFLGRELARSCYAYRVYLKAVPESPERKKATSESDQCERQLKALRPPPEDPAKRFVDQRAAFYAALDARELLGQGSASETLKSLVKDGFLGPELGEMAQKLGAAATAEAEAIHKRALAGVKLPPQTLRGARPLYQVAEQVGASPPDAKGRMAFLDGLAALHEQSWKKAESHFEDAAQSDPSNKEYFFFKGVALVQGGERAAALKVLEAHLKGDPRTAVLRAALALSDSPVEGSKELEKLLFATRNPQEK